MGCHISKDTAGLHAGAETIKGTLSPDRAAQLEAALEERRLAAVRTVRALDRPAEARFDRIIKLLQDLFKVPIALVSLIEQDQLVFLSTAGTTATGGRRLHSFCDASLKLPRPTVNICEDTLLDVRFQHGQFVEGPPHVRFYAGAPLISTESGYILGSLSIMDVVPRKFPAEMYTILCNMAEVVVRELERDKVAELGRQREQQRCLARALSCFNEAIAFCDLSDRQDWRLLFGNLAWEALVGSTAGSSPYASLWELLEAGDHERASMAGAHAATAGADTFCLQLTVKHGPRAGQLLRLSFHPATNDRLGEGVPIVGIPNFVEMADGGLDCGGKHYFVTAQESKPASSCSPRGMVPSLRSSFDLASTPPTSSSTTNGNATQGSSRSSLSASRQSSYGLERPEALKDLKLGPVLGQGSYGVVYRAKWHGAHVAVKVLEGMVEVQQRRTNTSADASSMPSTPSGAMLEALLGRELSHPHVVKTHGYAISTVLDGPDPQDPDFSGQDARQWDVKEQDGEQEYEDAPPPKVLHRTWIIQQYCSGGTLIDAIERGWLRTKRDLDGPIDLLAVLLTAQEVASGMSYLHAHDVLHGDLSCNNVLLASSTKDVRRFTALVGDFGLARSLAGCTTIETQSHGTVSAMAPEVLMEGMVTKAADVYSFGVLLWEMFCQERAWHGMRPSQIVFLITNFGQELEVPDDAPPGLRALMAACLHKDRSQRPTFDQALESLEGLLREARQQAMAQAAAKPAVQ